MSIGKKRKINEQIAFLNFTGFSAYKEYRNIYSSMVPNVCPGTEYKRRRIFVSERELLLSEVVGKKDKMSNRAERLSDRAKRGSDSVARLDSPSDRRSRKGKVLSRKLSSSKFVLSSPGTHNCHQGGHIFLLCWSLFNHKSLPNVLYILNYSGLLFLLPFIEYYRFASKIFNYKISMSGL